MKIINLKFKAFGPFLKEQCIDFSGLNAKGLFLINGPTGTGKTTIFDAVVFALYGKGSGKDRDDGKSLRSDFAKDDEITYVELIFEANGQTYKIYRQMAYLRQSKRGEGSTTQEAKVELYMPGGEVISRTKDVEDKIENKILFITREQFKTVALLAQGEFTELITADSKKRASILEHIFQKEMYEEFQNKLTAQTKKIEDNMKSIIASINTLINKVEGGDQITGYKEGLEDPTNVPIFVNNLKLKIEELENEYKILETKLKSAENEYQKASNNLEIVKNSNDLYQKYLDAKNLLEELNKKENAINVLRQLLEQKLEFNAIKPLFDHLDSLTKLINDNLKQIADNKLKLSHIESEKKWLSDNQDLYKTKKDLSFKLNNSIKSLEGVITSRKELIIKKNYVDVLEKNYIQTYNKHKALEEEFLDIKNRFFASSSYNLSLQLEEGKPCPVCGSLSHPDKAKSSNPVSEEQYKNKEKEVSISFDKLVKEKNNFDKDKTAFETEENNLIKTLIDIGFADTNRDFIYSDKLKEELDNLNKQFKDIDDFIKNYDKKKIDVSTAETKINESIDNAKKIIADSENTINEINEDIKEKLESNKSFKSENDYRSYIEVEKDSTLKTTSNIEKFQKDIREYDNNKTKAKAIIDNTPSEIIESGALDETKLIEEHKNKKNNYDSLNEETNTLKNKIANLKKDVKSINETYEKCENIIKKYSSLNELSKTANGSNRLKLSFKMYVLADYFDKIIVQANRRLSKITNGRYRLIRRTEVKGNGQQGLDLDVFDIDTGKQRPASSLSGGEKFVSALSLALGLSDIIETNHALIQVESIFIDEGFGSLDENYLDMAMKALETLKDDNKSVAIISHVEKLKEYIPDGLEIKKDDTGSKIVYKAAI